MLKITLKPSFVRQFDKLPRDLQEEVTEKIGLFSTKREHPSLRVHKLKGSLRGFSSFSVNFKYRVVFFYESKTTVTLVSVGDHQIYR